MSEALAKRDVVGLPGDKSAVHWSPPESLTIDDWLVCMEAIAQASGATMWWWGDGIRFGERKYGEMYKQALDLGPYDYQTLRIAVWVAKHVELLRRRNNLSWSHHREVAKYSPDEQDYWLSLCEPAPGETKAKMSHKELRAKLSQKRLAEEHARQRGEMLTHPLVWQADCLEWLPMQPLCDLLLTDPPYKTDVGDITEFAHEWLPLGLRQVLPTGRAYVFIGRYPEELLAYLTAPREHMTLANVLVWEYTNTLGPSPEYDYKTNWQAVLYFRGPDAPPLDCPVLLEQFSVQKVNAPGGFGNEFARIHAWQKPDELAEMYIRHSTQPGQLVLDPFAGTGTFSMAAHRLGRIALACERDEEMLAKCLERGCQRAPD